MLAITIKTDTKNLTQFAKTLPKNMRDELGDATFNFAKITRDSLRKELLTTRNLTSSRAMASQEIVAKRVSKFRSTVNMPLKLKYLDSMTPHYVSLKRGRRVTAWTRKHFGTAIVGGKSRVYRGPRGGIVGGALWVEPIPFVDKGLRRARKRLVGTLRRGVRKAYRKSIRT